VFLSLHYDLVVPQPVVDEYCPLVVLEHMEEKAIKTNPHASLVRYDP
jgi:hypothetical protein